MPVCFDVAEPQSYTKKNAEIWECAVSWLKSVTFQMFLDARGCVRWGYVEELLDDIKCEMSKCEGNTTVEQCIDPICKFFVATWHLTLRVQSKTDLNTE